MQLYCFRTDCSNRGSSVTICSYAGSELTALIEVAALQYVAVLFHC